MQLPSLSLSFIHSLKTQRSSPRLEKGNAHTHTHTRSEHENTKLPFEQKDKNGLLWFIRLGKQQKKEKKNIVQTGILLTQTNHHTSVALTVKHTHSQKYSLL